MEIAEATRPALNSSFAFSRYDSGSTGGESASGGEADGDEGGGFAGFVEADGGGVTGACAVAGAEGGFGDGGLAGGGTAGGLVVGWVGVAGDVSAGGVEPSEPSCGTAPVGCCGAEGGFPEFTVVSGRDGWVSDLRAWASASEVGQRGSAMTLPRSTDGLNQPVPAVSGGGPTITLT